MEKRLILAMALSLLIIISWSTLMSKFYPVEKQEVMKKEPLPVASPASTLPVASASLPEEKISIGAQEFQFILPYGALKEVLFQNYHHYFNLGQGFFWPDASVVFKKERLGPQTRFLYADAEKQIIKDFLFHKSNYTIELHIKIKNLKTTPLSLNSPLILAKIDLKVGPEEARFQEVVLGLRDKILKFSARKQFSPADEIKFLAFKDRYFCAIIEPQQRNYKYFSQRISPQEIAIGLSSPLEIESGSEKELSFLIYLGPQNLALLNSIRPEWQGVVAHGLFDGIAQWLIKLLNFFYGIVHNWGVALVLLSVFIYSILFPLSLKQIRSIKKMQELQPQIEQLREQHKNNPQRLNKEMLELYRREKVNPLGGCLPLVLQMPIFFALYQALMRSSEIKGQSFLWIKDLSLPDRLFVLPQALPILGNEINILPLLMTAVMFLQQKFTQVSTLGSASEQQRLMGILMPLLFGMIFYHMPSGLVLYWFINSLLMTLFQWQMRPRSPGQ